MAADLVVEHSALGDRLPLFAPGLLAAAVLVTLVQRRDGLGRLAVVAALVAGLAATVWVVRVGESGTRAVWGPVVEFTDP